MSRHLIAVRSGVAVLVAVLLAYAFQARAEVVDIETRDTKLRLLIEGPDNPSHVVALLAGGDGAVEIADNGDIGWGKGNFAIRPRRHLHALGIATAVLAPAADMPTLRERRDSPEYAEDLGNVVAYLRQRFGKPVWLHGTSRGTVGIALAVPKIKDVQKRPDGLILSSSITVAKKSLGTVLDGDLGRVGGPVLVVHHKNDPCEVTPVDKADEVADAFSKAKPVKLLIMEGGDDKARGDPCEARSQHGFAGVERSVIEQMAAFIKNPG